MYALQKYGGITSRHTCPACGRKRCFTLYVDEAGEPLHETVGRCDHESSCHYHYTPRQYYHDHPDQKPGRDWREPDRPRRSATSFRHRETPACHSEAPACHSEVKPKNLCYIPDDLVNRSVRPDRDSALITFLRTLLDPVVIEGLIDEYRLGVTRGGDTIFFQLDAQGRCRTGKVMKYNPETGHRIKDPDVPGRITWIHSLMKQTGRLPADWTLTQCLFGEHLLPAYPGKPVALVESEKTAIICAGLMPRYLWLATGGKSQLNPDRLAALADRKVIAFPDIDAFDDWTEKLARNPDLDITVSPILQQNATPEDRANHIDIADWLIRSRNATPGPARASHSAAFLRAARFLDPSMHAELQALIDDLDLEFMEVGNGLKEQTLIAG